MTLHVITCAEADHGCDAGNARIYGRLQVPQTVLRLCHPGRSLVGEELGHAGGQPRLHPGFQNAPALLDWIKGSAVWACPQKLGSLKFLLLEDCLEVRMDWGIVADHNNTLHRLVHPPQHGPHPVVTVLLLVRSTTTLPVNEPRLADGSDYMYVFFPLEVGAFTLHLAPFLERPIERLRKRLQLHSST